MCVIYNIGINFVNMNNHEKHIVEIRKIQKCWREYKQNIYAVLKSNTVKKCFMNELRGFHLINTCAIKESFWEEINRNIVRDKCVVNDIADGNHKSGKDMRFNDWNISNKTCKLEKNNINISSYRLSSVCNNKEIGTKEHIMEEIEKRDNSFEYYSILIRDEHKDKNQITYHWCIIPKTFFVFDLNNQSFVPKIGVKGKSKGKVAGWKGEYFDITFSMSSQLWFHMKFNHIKKYIIHSIIIPIVETYSYGDIYKMVTSN